MSEGGRFLLAKKKVGCLLSIYAIGGRGLILRNRPVLDPRSTQSTHLAHLALKCPMLTRLCATRCGSRIRDLGRLVQEYWPDCHSFVRS
jgi:hypothetical protein